jgi:hypothetical protein
MLSLRAFNWKSAKANITGAKVGDRFGWIDKLPHFLMPDYSLMLAESATPISLAAQPTEQWGVLPTSLETKISAPAIIPSNGHPGSLRI